MPRLPPKKTIALQPEYRVRLKNPHEKQLPFVRSEAKRKICRAGRRVRGSARAGDGGRGSQPDAAGRHDGVASVDHQCALSAWRDSRKELWLLLVLTSDNKTIVLAESYKYTNGLSLKLRIVGNDTRRPILRTCQKYC